MKKDLIVGTSRARNIVTSFSDTSISCLGVNAKCIPGASYATLVEEGVKDLKLSPSSQETRHVYLMGGLPDLTTRLTNRKTLKRMPMSLQNRWRYEEVIHEGTVGEAADRVIHEINRADTIIRSHGAVPCFCTIVPMSFRKWNKTRHGQKKTYCLKYFNKYEEMQNKHLEATNIVNRHIYHINKQNGMATPKTAEKVFILKNPSRPLHMSFGRLVDGVHCDDLTNLALFEELLWTILRNRHKRRVGRLERLPKCIPASPEWMEILPSIRRKFIPEFVTFTG